MNTTPWSDAKLEAHARRRVARKTGFYIHALVFVLVNLGLAGFSTFGDHPRSLAFPAWGWSLGLAIYGFVTFVSLQGDGLRQRMLRSEIERLRRQRG